MTYITSWTRIFQGIWLEKQEGLGCGNVFAQSGPSLFVTDPDKDLNI